MIRTLAAVLTAAVFLLALPATGQAQQAEDIGDYRVHYSAMNTNMLPTDVARAYGIQRSSNRALINLAVLRKAGSEDELDTPTRARIDVSARNLTGQPRPIGLQEIQEENAIYYIGTFRITNEETLTFDVEVRPEGMTGPAETFSFQQKFYTD